MKSGVLWLALAVSVLFNVFFVAGYIKAQSTQSDDVVHTSVNDSNPGSEAEQQRLTRMVTQQLELTADQQELFEQLQRDREADEQEFQASIELIQRTLIRELEKPEPDVDEMQRLADQQGELRRRKRQLDAGRFSSFVELLTPQQREKLSSQMRRGREDRGRRGGGQDFLIRRFDADGDGTLNEEENAAAQRWQEQREKEWQDIRKRFDADGDGKLDDEESKAHRQWRRERDVEKTRQRFDANDDGQLDAEEEAAMQEWLSQRRERGGSPGSPRRGNRGDNDDQRGGDAPPPGN